MEYITYEQFIEYIKKQVIPFKVEVTLPWFRGKKLNVNPSDIRRWGARFHEECENYGYIAQELGTKANYVYYKVREAKK